MRVQYPLRIDDFNEPEPDVVVLRPRLDFYASNHPKPVDCLLIVEVADTSLAHDMSPKAALYAGAGLPEYWVIDLIAKRAIIMTCPRGQRYEVQRIAAAGEPLESLAFPDCSVNPLAMFPSA